MKFLDTLEKKFGRFTFPYLLPLLLSGQVLVFLAVISRQIDPTQMFLTGSRLFQGEIHRIFTFMVVPMAQNPLFFALSIYVTWLIGSALENQWGEFRFSLYIGLSWFCTVLASLLLPYGIFTNAYVMASLILAFARLFPNIEFLLFFIIPVKVKYIGYVMWAQFAFELIGGSPSGKMSVLAAILPFLVFFGNDILGMIKQKKRASEYKKKAQVDAGTPFHQCSSCPRNDIRNPELAFRYDNGKCVCEICLQERNKS